MYQKEKANNSKVQLSVVVVSYNCIPFLRLCLDSLLWKYDERMEVFVVDNNSSDATVDVLRNHYPHVKLIVNKVNVGFGRACNQAMKEALGNYYLMLNPDTVVDENLVDNVLSFMQQHPKCGGMGVYMSDGKGSYLPESKRGLPTLFRSLCRFSGITRLFPKSKLLAGYYMGHLPIHQVNEVEILSGAFMVLSAQAIENCGAFDERFFMYGEDIDLSWRLIKGGYKNYYNPQIAVVHFKGETTVKDAKYVNNFFGAMSLFYDIHFNSRVDRMVRPLVFLFTHLLSKIKQVQLKRSTNRGFSVTSDLTAERVIVTHDTTEAFANKGWKTIGSSEKSNEQWSTWIDMATLKPSEAIQFVHENGVSIPQITWLNSHRTDFFKVVSSDESTVIGKWNEN